MKPASLYSKLFVLILGLLLASSVATLAAVITATDANIKQQARTRLEVGASVLQTLLANRAQQLLESARVLTADFGFKRAVALKDVATIHSVLENHGARINADVVTLLDTNGALIASTMDTNLSGARAQAFNEKLGSARHDGQQIALQLGDKAYQLVVVDVRAPAPIARAIIGFEMDQSFAKALKDMTQLDISFTSGSQGRTVVSTLPDYDTSSNQAFHYEHLNTTLGDNSSMNAVLSVSLAEETARFQTLRVRILIISATVLLGSLVTLLALLHGFTRPIQRLVAGARRISGGDYSHLIAESATGGAEILQLAKSFNQMQSAVAERERKIVYQAHHDQLTGLVNRSKLALDLAAMISASQSGEAIAVVSLYLQRLKVIGNALGADIGEALLIRCAERCQALFPSPAVIGRSGDTEFTLLVPLSHGESIESVTAKIQSAWAESIPLNELDFVIPTTVGVATYPEHGATIEPLLRRSAIALNQAVDKGQNKRIYQHGDDQQHAKKIRLINDLKNAVQQEQLTLHYQPKIRLDEQRVSEAEALVRWRHPQLGFIPPDQFISLAEQSGLMPALSRWVLRRGIADASAWQAGGHDAGVAINLSAYDLMHDDLPAYVSELLAEYNYPHDKLILEVTESAMLEDPDKAIQVLNRFHEQNISLAIDDYGTGYSSLGQLKQLPVDELKIDMCFIRKLAGSTNDQIIVQSTIQMAHNIGLKVVAEGVEDADSWRLLEQWGCDKLQGFYISKPAGADEFVAWLSRYQFPTRMIPGESANEDGIEPASLPGRKQRTG